MGKGGAVNTPSPSGRVEEPGAAEHVVVEKMTTPLA